MDTGTSEDPPLEGDWFELHIPGGEKITFHADHVQRHSMILGWMMSESPREAWARGLAAAFDGRAPAHIKLFMALASTEDAILQVECKKLLELSSIASWDVLEGVVRLADLLNAPAIMEACENLMIELRINGAGGLVGTLNTASKLGLENARQACLADLLSCMMAPHPGQHLEKLPGTVPGTSSWENLQGSDAKILLQALMRSRHELTRSFEDVVVSYVRDEYCKSKAQERLRNAMSLQSEKIRHYLR